MSASGVVAQQEIHNKIESLYTFLKEMCALRSASVKNASKYPWMLSLNDVDGSDFVAISYRDGDSASDETDPASILRVSKPDFEPCPNPPAGLAPWLVDGWDDYTRPLQLRGNVSGGGFLFDAA